MELKNLLLYRSLKFQFKEVSYEDLIKIKANIDELVNERLEEIEEQKKTKEANEKKLKEALNTLKKMGVNPEDLVYSLNSENKPSSRKGVKMPPKYKYPDPDNEEISLFWTGQGKIPNKFQKVLDNTGNSLEDYKI